MSTSAADTVIKGGYLVYHPRRTRHVFDRFVAHADPMIGNQDPYIWSKSFLHTYCHMAQMAPREGDACIWVTGDRWPNFDALYCDLVFVVQQKKYWKEANRIGRDDPIVESDHAWNDHYQWGNWHHRYKTRRRYTLKAHPGMSFQPQLASGELIDIVPFFKAEGVGVPKLREWLCTRRGSKPKRIDHYATKLYAWIMNRAIVLLKGADFEPIRIQNPQLGSPAPAGQDGCCPTKGAPRRGSIPPGACCR